MQGMVGFVGRRQVASALLAFVLGTLGLIAPMAPADAATGASLSAPNSVPLPAPNGASPSAPNSAPRSESNFASHPAVEASTSRTVWLCRPGMAADPCTSSLQTEVVLASGARSLITPSVASASKFDCFYAYPTVSHETTLNSDLAVQKAEIATAIAQASPFSTVCRVWAPMYRQFTLFALQKLLTQGVSANDLAVLNTAYESLKSGFEDYLTHYNEGRPIIFIGHSQGASLLVSLLKQLVDGNPALRSRLVLAIILGANVVVADGSREGGSFSHIPVCSSNGEAGCVIAYSSFPSQPPATSFFGRPGQGVSLLSGQLATTGVHVACVNPAALGGGSAALDPFFPTEGLIAVPWVEYPDLYAARCETGGGANYLQVTKISGASDRRPVVTEPSGPDWGYHDYDINLALGNLLADTAAAEKTWSRALTVDPGRTASATARSSDEVACPSPSLVPLGSGTMRDEVADCSIGDRRT